MSFNQDTDKASAVENDSSVAGDNVSDALETLAGDKANSISYNITSQTGGVTCTANTFYMNCNPANATQNYTFPASPNVGDKVGFRISGVSESVVPTLIATIDGVTNVDIDADGDFVFVYTGAEWTAILGGVSYV